MSVAKLFVFAICVVASSFVVNLAGAADASSTLGQASASPRNYRSLKIAPPPGGGIYLGQYEWDEGDTATFEQAIGRKAALWSPYRVMTGGEDAPPRFDVEAAERAWREGYVVMGCAFEATTGPKRIIRGKQFTVDRLLSGKYEEDLKKLAEQFRRFGKPMFFSTAREPNGVLAKYWGGFGPEGDKSFRWAAKNGRGLAEFDPSAFPHAKLYADLGDPAISDGVERLVAAQRYYHNFFVQREGLHFLTFDTMGWGAMAPIDVEAEAREIGLDPDPTSHAYKMLKSCHDFRYFYPGDEYVDWVSFTWYVTEYTARSAAQGLAYWVGQARKVAPDKPVILMELGFLRGNNEKPSRSAERVRAGLESLISRYPEVHGLAMWSDEFLVRPNTPEARAFREAINAEPHYFHSYVYLSDGRPIPGAESIRGVSGGSGDRESDGVVIPCE